MGQRNLQLEIDRILSTRRGTSGNPSAYQIIAENLQRIATHYLVLNPREIESVIITIIGGGTATSGGGTLGESNTFQRNVQRRVAAFCNNSSAPSFLGTVNMSSSLWGGTMQIATSIPSDIRSASGGTVYMIPPTQNFNLEEFGRALTRAKDQALLFKLQSDHEEITNAVRQRARGDLAKLHGIGDYHSTARVGTATAGPKSNEFDPLQGSLDFEFGLPVFRKALLDDLTMSGHITSAGTTSHTGVGEEVQILLEIASRRGKQAEQDEWDAPRGARNELTDALERARRGVMNYLALEYGEGSNEWHASASPQKRLKRMAAEVVTKQMVKGIKPPTKIRKKITEPKVKKGKKTTSASRTKKAPNKRAKKQVVQVKKGNKSRRSGIQRKRATPWRHRAGINPIGLKALIQKSLPETVARRMTGAPTLQYRTGRFARSAEIVDIVPMPRSVEIRYDYMQDPYRVFEPEGGHPLSSAKRDPKDLIGSSIREIAQMIMGTRFGIVRTKRV